MPTLLIRLCGPMQSWGTQSRFTERDTEREPTKSGVVGLLCAALGRSRDADVSDLAALRMGVRVDREGVVLRDYHTAGAGTGIRRASGALSKDPVVSNRYYLADADFLVGLEGEDAGLLQRLDQAVRRPRWQLYLGRKAFVPALPPYLPGGGLRDLPLEEALLAEPWPLSPAFKPLRGRQEPDGQLLRFVFEVSHDTPGRQVRQDQPIGAAFAQRSFGPRPVFTQFHRVRSTPETEKGDADVPQPVDP
jgi:CRISPR system Cascade subunit CasD